MGLAAGRLSLLLAFAFSGGAAPDLGAEDARRRSQLTSPRTGLLIVNADDYGHDVLATDETASCFGAGRITSASAMTFMEDSDRASVIAREVGLPVGLHLNLTEPFSDPATPPSVRARQARLARRFGSGPRRRVLRWLFDPRIQREVEQCIADQLTKFIELYGRPPTHFDGHQHVHQCPNVFLARSLPDGACMRGSLDTHPLRRFPRARARGLRQRLIARRFHSTDHLFDIADVDPRLKVDRRVLDLTVGATVEVMMHPGFDHERERVMTEEWKQVLRERRTGSFADLRAETRTPLPG